MQATIINGGEHIVEKYEETGDLLILRRISPTVNKRIFLLTGDSHKKTDYELPLQVFSFLKKQGFGFLLFILVPDRLKDSLVSHADSLELSDRTYTIGDCAESDESLYEEIIDVTTLFNTGLILKKSGKVIERTFSTIAENLKSSFGEKQDESRQPFLCKRDQ